MSEAHVRLEELLVDRATFDLDPGEERELAALLGTSPDLDSEELELAAAAVDLALQRDFEPMPDTVRARLWTQASSWASDTVDRAAGEESSADGRSPNWSWWIAAAAAIVALLGWWPSMKSDQGLPSPIQMRDQLIAEANDAIVLEWGATDDPAASGASGSVVWSAERQEGYMTIAGLQINDPSQFQYQLWVFDAQRDERYPVDGGVFDVNSTEVVIPIHTTLEVSDATLFAVTVERPGGVMVSDRSRIVLAAARS